MTPVEIIRGLLLDDVLAKSEGRKLIDKIDRSNNRRKIETAVRPQFIAFLSGLAYARGQPFPENAAVHALDYLQLEVRDQPLAGIRIYEREVAANEEVPFLLKEFSASQKKDICKMMETLVLDEQIRQRSSS